MKLKDEFFLRVAIMGATGAVGQQLVMSLMNLVPDVDLYLAASSKSKGKCYKEAALYWTQEEPLPERLGNKTVQSIEDSFDAFWVFSALPSELASFWEPYWRDQGKCVISMASANRLKSSCPMVVKDVNQDHLHLVLKDLMAGKGAIICKPNCVAAILATFLKPLVSQGLKSVKAVSLQSISGAGFPGVSAWQMTGDFIPWIEAEAEKIEAEMPKLLGLLNEKNEIIEPISSIKWNFTCMRVPVIRGHSLQLNLEFEKNISNEAFYSLLDRDYLTFVSDFNQLTPRKVVDRRLPMQVFWGNYRKRDTSHDVFIIGDNLGRGASTGAIEIWLALHSLMKKASVFSCL